MVRGFGPDAKFLRPAHPLTLSPADMAVWNQERVRYGALGDAAIHVGFERLPVST